MTPDQLENLLAAATPGPWKPVVWLQHTEKRIVDYPASGPFADVEQQGSAIESVFSYRAPRNERRQADVDAIVALRNRAPALLRLWRVSRLHICDKQAPGKCDLCEVLRELETINP